MSELVIPYALEVLDRELQELQGMIDGHERLYEEFEVDLTKEGIGRMRELERQLIQAILYLETESKKAGEKV